MILFININMTLTQDFLIVLDISVQNHSIFYYQYGINLEVGTIWLLLIIFLYAT